MPHMANLQDLFVDELKDLFNAENQILKALPRMAKKAQSQDLKQAFQEHLTQTQGQVERLEQIFDKMGMKGKGKVCKGMQGIIEEGKEVLQEEIEPDAIDAALIAAAQRVEHYEIAGYGTARSFAQMLGDAESAKLLQQTLDEEGQTDKKLTKLAEDFANKQAKQQRPA